MCYFLWYPSLWGLALPHPLLVGLLLLLLCFPGLCFLQRLCLACWLLLGRLGHGGTPMFLLQGVYLGGHGHNLFLIFSGIVPGIFFVQQLGFVLVFCPYHDVLCHEHCSSIVTLALEVLDVDDKFFIWGCFIGFPEIVEKVERFLFSCMKVAHLLLYPSIEFHDVALEEQQFPFGFNQHFPDMHH